jgi:hypothetical protein
MKKLILPLLIILLSLSSSAIADEDYKRLYLEQSIKAENMELQLIRNKYEEVAAELSMHQRELSAYIEDLNATSTKEGQ